MIERARSIEQKSHSYQTIIPVVPQCYATLRSRSRADLGGEDQQTTSSMRSRFTMNEQAVELTLNDHPDHAHWLYNLTSALHCRCERTGSMNDLDRDGAGDCIQCSQFFNRLFDYSRITESNNRRLRNEFCSYS